MNDGQIAWRWLKGQAGRSKPECKCLQVDPGSHGFEEAVYTYSGMLGIGHDDLSRLLTALIECDEDVLRDFPTVLRERTALRLSRLYLRTTERPIKELRRWARSEASLLGIPGDEFADFINRQCQKVLDEIFTAPPFDRHRRSQQLRLIN